MTRISNITFTGNFGNDVYFQFENEMIKLSPEDKNL